MGEPLTTIMEQIETITPASVLPVPVDTLKLHLRLNDTSEDDLLSDWLWAAADLFTNDTGYVLTSTTYRLRLDRWPCGRTIYIPRTPVTSITSVEYLDTAGDWQTVGTSDYSTDLTGIPARIIFADTFSPPTLHTTQRPAVRCTFVAGHATDTAVPKLAATCVRLLASHYYNVREAWGEVDLKETPAGWRAATARYRTGVNGNWNERGDHAGSW